MPVNGIPSDEWKVKRALGPYAREMDDQELKELQEKIRQKKSSAERKTSREDEEVDMPF